MGASWLGALVEDWLEGSGLKVISLTFQRYVVDTKRQQTQLR